MPPRVDALEFVNADGAALGQSVKSFLDSADDALFELRDILYGGLVPPDLLHPRPINPGLNAAWPHHAVCPFRRFA